MGRALEDPAFTPSVPVNDLIKSTEERLKREHELLDRLRAIDAPVRPAWHDVVATVELMQRLSSTIAARRQQAILSPSQGAGSAELLAGAVLTESDPHVAGALRWALARSGSDGVAALSFGSTPATATSAAAQGCPSPR